MRRFGAICAELYTYALRRMQLARRMEAEEWEGDS